MLVNRKPQRDIDQQPQSTPVIRKLPKLDIELRIKWLITVLLVATFAIVVTVRSETIVRAGYELVQVKSQALSLEKENELLRIDIAKLRAPQRIEQIATGELGMVMPKHVYYAESTSESTQNNAEKNETMVSKVVSQFTVNSGQ